MVKAKAKDFCFPDVKVKAQALYPQGLFKDYRLNGN